MEGGQDEFGQLMDGMPSLIAVTRGPDGSNYFADWGFDPYPMSWASRRTAAKGTASKEGIPARTGTVPGARADFSVDPTGCGDVWGATFFARLLAGDPTEEAMRAANRLAFEKLKHRGARGLHRLLPELP